MSQEEYQNPPRGSSQSQSRNGKRAAPSREEERRPRRRRRRGMGVLGALLYVIFVLGASALLAGLGWTWACDVLALSKDEHTAVITLPADIFTEKELTEEDKSTGDTTTKTVQAVDLDYVAEMLKEQGLIEYKFVFKLFAIFTHAQYKLSPGSYELNTDMDYRALLASMGKSSSNRLVTTVTITEGMRLEQIFALLEEKGVAPADDLRETAATYDYKFSFLQNVIPLGEATRLEGYLFPDTYEFYMGEDPINVLNKMLLRFDQIFTDDMRQEMADQGLTIRDAVIIASMIEKETDGTDQRHIASVIYNRWLSPTSETAGYLNIDAAILYATGGTEVDVNYNSPYNTHIYTGLPPTAISSPGSVALWAAVYPDSTSDYYYALGDDGVHHFFRTYSEQQAFIATQERYGNG